MNAFLGTFKGFHFSSCKIVMLRNSFSFKHLSMANANFQTYCCQSLVGYGSKIQDNKKSVEKTLLNILLTAKTEWPNV